jgi:hypothetical protein
MMHCEYSLSNSLLGRHTVALRDEYVINVHSCVQRGGTISLSKQNIASEGIKHLKLVCTRFKPWECDDKYSRHFV